MLLYKFGGFVPKKKNSD